MNYFAFSSLCGRYIDDIIDLAKKNPYKAVEWDMNFIPPTLNSFRLNQLALQISDYGLNIRYHLPYSYTEIAHKDDTIREFSLITIKRYLDYIHLISGNNIAYAVLHVGYDDSIEKHAIENLKDLASYAKNLNIVLCIENLIKGLTTDVDFVLKALEIDNIKLCFDTGHANVVINQQGNAAFIHNLNYLLEKCVHSHLYLTEDKHYNHVPFVSSAEIQQSKAIKTVLESKCNWFTMELDVFDDQLCQMQLFI